MAQKSRNKLISMRDAPCAIHEVFRNGSYKIMEILVALLALKKECFRAPNTIQKLFTPKQDIFLQHPWH